MTELGAGASFLRGPRQALHLLREPPLRDILTCLSLANICFLRVWKEILTYGRHDAFFMKQVPTPADYLAVMAAVLVVATILFAVAAVCRKYLPLPAYRVARFGSLAVALVPLNGVRVTLSRDVTFLQSPLSQLIGPRTVLFVILPLSLVMIWFAWKWQRLIVRVAVAGLLSLLPFCGLTFTQAAWSAVRYKGQPFHEGPLAPRLAETRAAPRVVWVIFDEWDYRLTFVDRPAKLSMPAVDRLRAESLSATNAHSPTMSTSTSMPSLITGRRLRLVAAGPGRFRRTAPATRSCKS